MLLRRAVGASASTPSRRFPNCLAGAILYLRVYIVRAVQATARLRELQVRRRANTDSRATAAGPMTTRAGVKAHIEMLAGIRRHFESA